MKATIVALINGRINITTTMEVAHTSQQAECSHSASRFSAAAMNNNNHDQKKKNTSNNNTLNTKSKACKKNNNHNRTKNSNRKRHHRNSNDSDEHSRNNDHTRSTCLQTDRQTDRQPTYTDSTYVQYSIPWTCTLVIWRPVVLASRCVHCTSWVPHLLALRAGVSVKSH